MHPRSQRNLGAYYLTHNTNFQNHGGNVRQKPLVLRKMSNDSSGSVSSLALKIASRRFDDEKSQSNTSVSFEDSSSSDTEDYYNSCYDEEELKVMPNSFEAELDSSS